MANIINGLEIVNKRMKEKELLTSEIFLWLVLGIAEIIKIFKQAGYEPTPYEKQGFLIKAHIVAEKKAEMLLKNKKRN
jgi:hypothetical protein